MAAHTSMRIGLTGGIGSGKSTVADRLATLGAVIVDTDAIARSLALPGGAAIASIRAAFGNSAIDATGGMDRTRMRELVFSDASAKLRLEGILHPMISAECGLQAQAAAGRPVIFDVPLLVESGRWRARLDRVLVVDCSEETQIERVRLRSGWTREAVSAVVAQQASRRARRAAADAVIFNEDLSLLQLAEQVDVIWKRWAYMEQSRRPRGASPS